MIQVFTVREFILLPQLAIDKAEVLHKALNAINGRRRITVDAADFIDREIKIFSNLILIMLDYKIQIPKLHHFHVSQSSIYFSIKMRTNYEIFNLLISESLPELYEDLKSISLP